MLRLKRICLIIIIIGALNTGLIGLFNFDLIATIFDMLTPIITRIIYALIGVAGIIVIAGFFDKELD